MNLVVTIFVCLSFSVSARAQFINTDNPLNAALNTTSAILQTFKKDSIPKDSLAGACEINNGTCNGAEIVLFDQDQKIFTATLTSSAEFQIPRLKRNVSYKFVLNWKKHNISEVRTVEAGQFVSIKISQK
jgi:hypothetical protein